MTDPIGVREATELLIETRGLEGALDELRERHKHIHVDDPDHGRVITALGIVKRRAEPRNPTARRSSRARAVSASTRPTPRANRGVATMMDDGVERSPVMTKQTHDCGKHLYRVGTDRVLFCPRCKVQPDTERSDSTDTDSTV